MCRLYRKWPFMVIFLYDLHVFAWIQHSGSICELSYIHNHAVMHTIMKAFHCVCLLTFSMQGRHYQHASFCNIFLFSPENSLWLFIQINIPYFLEKIRNTILLSVVFVQRVLKIMLVVIFALFNRKQQTFHLDSF